MTRKLNNAVTRRDFLRNAGAAALLSPLPVCAMHRAESHLNNKRLDRLACNSWPFRGYFDTPQMHEYRNAQYSLITQAEFPQFLADHFNIHNVEFLPQHFADTDSATIDKVKTGLQKANSRCCNLMGLELPGGAFTRSNDHKNVIKEADRWVRVALALGCPSITIALSGEGATDAQTAADNLKPFVDIAHGRGVKVLFHNDDLKRESAETLTSVIARLGGVRTGTCPDFGNFATKSAAFALDTLHKLAPYASNICHAKDGIADNGKFYADDFAASMKLMREIGFKGVYSLEFEGLDTPLDGVRKLMNLVLQYLS